MPYSLILTREERRAMDWIGERYRHGDELTKLLWGSCTQYPEEAAWSEFTDITFFIPESVAWDIQSIVQEGLDCFGPELVEKLHTLCSKIV